MHQWGISEAAARLHQDALVIDMVVPYEPEIGNDLALIARHRAAGINFVSLTIAGDTHGITEATRRIAGLRARILAEPGCYVLVEGIGDVLKAKEQNKLAVGMHFEGTR